MQAKSRLCSHSSTVMHQENNEKEDSRYSWTP